jgi:hypothetical protein
MSWGLVAVAGATLVGSAYSANRAGAAARAGARGADAATAETARQYDQTRNDLASGRSLYEGANSLLGQLYGIPIQTGQQAQNFTSDGELVLNQGGIPTVDAQRYASDPAYRHAWDATLANEQATRPGWNGQPTYNMRANNADWARLNETMARNLAEYRTNNPQAAPTADGGAAGGTPGQPNMAGFFTSPDYNFRRSEGNRDIQGTFAARGGAQSGNALRALTEFNSNLASGEFGNYFNRLTTLAGLGSASTNQTAAYGAQAAGQAGRNALIAGDARASGIAGRANAVGSGIEQLGGLAGYYFGNRQPQPYGGTGAGGYGWSGPGNVRYG